MPAKSEKQRRFMGAELGRLRSGKKTGTDMSEAVSYTHLTLPTIYSV